VTPTSLLRALPFVATGVGALAFALFVRFAIARAGLGKRRVLLAALALSALPALHVGLVWCGLFSEGYLRFARPAFTLVATASVAFVATRLARSRVKQGPWRTRLPDALSAGAALTAALAAAGPELGHPLDKLTVLVAIDRSRSIDLVPAADKRIRQELTVAELGMREDDRIGTIAFAAEATTEDPPRPKSDLPAPQRVVIGRDGTDLAAAIRRALAEVPPDSAARVVLMTDGVATRGDTLSAAAAAVAAGVPIDVVPLEQRAVPDVRVVALRAPTRADEGEAMDLRLVTSAPTACEIEVRIKRDGVLHAKAKAAICAGEDVLRIREKAPGPGLHRYDVEISALDPKLDQAAEDNDASVFVKVRGQAAALVLEGDAGKAAFVAKSLEAGAFRVDVAGATGVPADLGGLAGYDVVFLSDVRAPDLSSGQIEALASYVRDFGGGLVLLGGDRGMGPGGYAKTPIEEVSPVTFDLKQERRRASLAEVIGIDISGSMGATVSGHTKLELANEAAARSAALLGPGDLLGVEHVDTVVKWSVPLAPVTDKDAIDRAIRAVGVGGGGIFVDITLDAGYAALDRQSVNLKHMLLFADGADAERMGPGVEASVAGALRRGITTSVVALGQGSDVPELEKLSRLGNGRFYLVEDAARLPSVFAQETILASRSSIVEKPFSVARGASASMTAGIDFEAAPPLAGYVVTIPKGRASVLLTGPENDPVLAVWSAGLGRSAAFTSDLKDRWGAAWTRWPGAARMIAQVARDVARKGDDSRVRLEADAAGGVLSVRASVVGDDGRAQSFRRLTVHVAGPDGFARDVPLEATGAGAYAAEVPLSRPGTYVAVARDELGGEAVGTTGAVLGAGEELRPTGTDMALLGRIAELSGGKRRDTLAGIFSDRAAKRFSYDDVTRGLVIAAAFALLLAVAARRLAMPDAIEAWAAGVAGRAKARREGRAAAEAARKARIEAARAEATMSALLGAKARGAEKQASATANAGARGGAGASAGGGARAGVSAGVRVPVAAGAPIAKGASGAGGPAATPPPAQAPATAPAPAPPAQKLSAAEILLARRKGKRG
jgi:uncharacterized membrane protein